MKKGGKLPIKVRKRWVINPKTRIKRSEKVYSRPKEKTKLKRALKETNKG